MDATPTIVDRDSWQQQIDECRVREKAHTREGDAIAAARRRLPMVEVDPATPVVGAAGEVPLVETFDGRRQLLASYMMWYDGSPAAEQCEGCTKDHDGGRGPRPAVRVAGAGSGAGRSASRTPTART